MTDTATTPARWAQFSDRQLIELCCRKTNGLPTQFLDTAKSELISLIEQYTSGGGNALV